MLEKYSLYYPQTEELTRAVKVEPLNDYKLRLFFSNGEIKIYDFKPNIDKGGRIAELLKNKERFFTVKIVGRTAVWNFTGKPLDDIDICPEVLYWDSVSATN